MSSETPDIHTICKHYISGYTFHQNVKKIKTVGGILPQLYHYRPQRSWGKVMFLQASVILLTGGVPHIPPPRQQAPPRADPPGADTPHQSRQPPGSRHPRAQTTPPPWSRHPLVADPPGADTPRADTPPRSRHPRPPRRAYCEIRSTRVRYASYWNAILFCPYNDNQPVFRMTILSGFHDSHSYSKWQITRQFLTIKIILREWISDPISIRIDKFE